MCVNKVPTIVLNQRFITWNDWISMSIWNHTYICHVVEVKVLFNYIKKWILMNAFLVVFEPFLDTNFWIFVEDKLICLFVCSLQPIKPTFDLESLDRWLSYSYITCFNMTWHIFDSNNAIFPRCCSSLSQSSIIKNVHESETISWN